MILATVTSGKAMNATVAGLGLNGKMIVVGAADEPIQVPAFIDRRAAFGDRMAFGNEHRFARRA